MAVRDGRGDVKQTTAGFRGSLMVQSLTSAKSKFLSLGVIPHLCQKQIPIPKMEVCSAGGKAIMSSRESGGRETLGRFIKGRLEAAGVLQRGGLITSDTLAAYGRDSITLQKIDDKNYILEF